MLAWILIVGLSALVGVICGRYLRGRLGGFLSAAIPWFGLLAWLLIDEYLLPYRGGGASMWPIAQLFAGTVAALVGYGSCTLTRGYLARLSAD